MAQRCGTAVACSHGMVMGYVQKLNVGGLHIPEYDVPEAAIVEEQERLQAAVVAALQELDEEHASLLQLQQDEALLILDAHRMLLNDPEFIAYPNSLIAHQHINAEWALQQQVELLANTFERMHDAYLRSKRLDIEQVGARLQRHLLACPFQPSACSHQATIMLMQQLSPSELLALWRAGVAGVLCVQGSLNTHAMIVARGLGMPTLMGVDLELADVDDGALMVLNAERNLWQLSPNEEEQAAFRQEMQVFALAQEGLMYFATRSSRSRDGVLLPIGANMDICDALDAVAHVGAEEIGLCRTEMMFLKHHDVPSEHEQFQAYVRIVLGARGLPVTFRLLDVGGDKPELFHRCVGHAYQADNPNLGLRGVRLLLQNPDVLHAQLRALLRAAVHGDVRVLVPMVSRSDEIPKVRDALEACAQDLGMEMSLALGCMIETPAAVMMADVLAQQSDFLSIGSNDLTQYTFAADRGDEDVAAYYQEEHGIILDMIEQVVRKAHQRQIKVSVCGELAAHEGCTQAFLDMGVDALSMSTQSILPIRRHLSRLRQGAAQ